MHQKQPVIFNEKTELYWVGLEPATSHILDGCSATKAAQLAEPNPKMLGKCKATKPDKQVNMYMYIPLVH